MFFWALLALLINCFYRLLHLNVMCFEQINLIWFDLIWCQRFLVFTRRGCSVKGNPATIFFKRAMASGSSSCPTYTSVQVSFTYDRLVRCFCFVDICIAAVPSLPALGPWAAPAERGPSLPGFPYSWSLRRLRQKISSSYYTVICSCPSAAQEQPFTVGLFCITKTVTLTARRFH